MIHAVCCPPWLCGSEVTLVFSFFGHEYQFGLFVEFEVLQHQVDHLERFVAVDFALMLHSLLHAVDADLYVD